MFGFLYKKKSEIWHYIKKVKFNLLYLQKILLLMINKNI